MRTWEYLLLYFVGDRLSRYEGRAIPQELQAEMSLSECLDYVGFKGWEMAAVLNRELERPVFIFKRAG